MNGLRPANCLQEQGMFEIHMAATQSAPLSKHLGVMRRIEKGEVDIRAKHNNGAGVTALHMAVGSKGAPVDHVKFLLEHGADPLKQGAYFEYDELVDAFEIVLEGIDVQSFFFTGGAAGRKKTINEEKLECLIQFHEKTHGSKLPEVYFAGRNMAAQAVPLLLSPEIRVKRVLVGKDCAALLSDSGGVFTWGSSSAQGRLGHVNKQGSVGPRRVFGSITSRRIVDIAVGSAHMLAVDDFGFAFGWGLNRMNLLGIRSPSASLNYYSVPTSINTLAGHRIVAVAAGTDHSIFLSDKGWPFVAGNASQGKLGLFADESGCSNHISDCPIRINVLAPKKWARADAVARNEEPALAIRKISAGPGHSLLLDSEGSVWGFGRDEDGRVSGTPTPVKEVEKYSDGRTKPTRFNVRCIYLPSKVAQFATSISAGPTCSCILARDGSVALYAEGASRKVGSNISAISCGPLDTVVVVDRDGMAARCEIAGHASGLRPLSCNDRVAEASEGQFGTLLRVGSNRSVLGEQLLACFKSAWFSDVSFRCLDNILVPAHRCMLVARLDKSSPLLAQEGKEILCSDVPASLVELFLTYLYTDRCVPALDQVTALITLAEKWRMEQLRAFLLKQSSEKMLESHMKDLLASEACADLKLSIGDGNVEMKVHRAILVARSEYHRTLFMGGFSESTSETLHVDTAELQNLSASLSSSTNSSTTASEIECVRLMFEFLYCDTIDLKGDANIALLLMALANRFSMRRLLFLCEQVVLESIEPESLPFVFVLANQFNASELKSGCVVLAKRFWDEVCESEAFIQLPLEDKQLLAANVGKPMP